MNIFYNLIFQFLEFSFNCIDLNESLKKIVEGGILKFSDEQKIGFGKNDKADYERRLAKIENDEEQNPSENEEGKFQEDIKEVDENAEYENESLNKKDKENPTENKKEEEKAKNEEEDNYGEFEGGDEHEELKEPLMDKDKSISSISHKDD